MTKSFGRMEYPPLISHFTSVNELNNNKIWLSSGYGLVTLNQTSKSYKVELRSDSRFCDGYCSMRGIDMDKYNNLWFASYSGIIRKSPSEMEVIDKLNSVVSNGIYSLHTIQDYVIVNDALYHMLSTSVKELIDDKQNGHVTNIVIPPNDIWMSTCFEDGNQIRVFNYNLKDKKLLKLELPDHLQNSGQLNNLIVSKDKTQLYMCTSNSGTYVYDLNSKEFRWLSESTDKAINNESHYNLIDNGGRLFIGSENQVVEIRKENNNIEIYPYHIYSQREDIHLFGCISIFRKNL